MRFKIGDNWHEAEVDKPLMIEFEGEQLNIAAMPKDCTRFAIFHAAKEEEVWSKEKRLAWMNDGAKVQTDKMESMNLEPGTYTLEVRKIITNKELIKELSKAVDENVTKISEWIAFDKGKDE